VHNFEARQAKELMPNLCSTIKSIKNGIASNIARPPATTDS
jgi:hypothetical protein